MFASVQPSKTPGSAVSNLGREWRKEWEQQLHSPPLSRARSPIVSAVVSPPSKLKFPNNRNNRHCCSLSSSSLSSSSLMTSSPLSRAMTVWMAVFLIYYGIASWLTFRVWPHHTQPVDSSERIERFTRSDSRMMRVSKVISKIRRSQQISSEHSTNHHSLLQQSKMKQQPSEMMNHKQIISPRPVFDSLHYNRGKSQSLRIGIAVTITKYPGLNSGFLDSLGSLAVSILEAQSRHNVSLMIIMHNNLTIYDRQRPEFNPMLLLLNKQLSKNSKLELTAADVMRAFGFRLIYKELPFEWTEVKNERIGREMLKDGCCGIAELLKLYVWTFDGDFDYVLSLDADSHFHRNFDELFDIMHQGGFELGFTHGASAKINQEVMNGGFLLVKPNMSHYIRMKQVLMEGDFTGAGWKKSSIGWVYGGRTIQGIVPYYFLTQVSPVSVISAAPINARWMKDRMFANKSQILKDGRKSIGYIVTTPGSKIVEFERCKYNNMVEVERCKQWEFEQVTSNHFTVCQKPWYCIYQRIPICDSFRDSWWNRSHTLETGFLGLPKPREECPKRRYQSIDYSRSPLVRSFVEHKSVVSN